MSSFLQEQLNSLPLEHLRGFYTNEKGEKVEIMFERATLEVKMEKNGLSWEEHDPFEPFELPKPVYSISLKPNDQGHVLRYAPLERTMEE